MFTQAPKIRYYVHGDLHENRPNTYYCARCDAFVQCEHFDETSHVESRAKRFNQSLEAWKRDAKSRGTKFHRPADAANIIAVAAAADIKTEKEARSPFYRWLLRQLKRNDPIGDLARDAWSDETFPATTSVLEKLNTHLHRHNAIPDAFVALDEAWSEFKSKSRARVGLGQAQRFAIFKRDQYRCRLCGATAEGGRKLEIDHKIAVVNGGSNEPDNLWVLCFECNRGKSANEL